MSDTFPGILYSVYELYPALAPLEDSDELAEINHHFIISPGLDRSPALQAALTLAALAATLAVALPAGIITGQYIIMINSENANELCDFCC